MAFSAKLNTGNLISASYPVLVVPAYEDNGLPADLKDLDKAWKGALSRALKNDVLTKAGEVQVIPNPINKGIQRIAFVGMGPREEVDLEAVRRAAGTSANHLRKRDVGRIVFLAESFMPLRGELESTARALIEGARLGAYVFDEFKSEKDTHVLSGAELHLPRDTKTRELMPILDETMTLTSSTILARDWINTPSNFATPTHLARLARDIAKDASLAVKILEQKECEKLGMGGFLNVAKGSDEPPKFIILDYKPRKYQRTLCLVGKAITFDSGGISIKPALDMHVMKGDMGGGLAVIAAMRAVGMLKPENVRIVGIVPACENMPSGRAQKPGDIIRTQSGKSIEVINTDAEGRLILADGLEYARNEFEPTALVDVATLTGAMVIALGEGIAGYLTDDEDLASALAKASEMTGEKAWRMPLEKDYRDHLKSDCADTKNTGKREGGAITAALFLQKFVGDTPWMHVDIAGPFWSNENRPYSPKGATGYGPRLLFNFIREWMEE